MQAILTLLIVVRTWLVVQTKKSAWMALRACFKVKMPLVNLS
jgi:hypothetical protein